MDRTVSGQFSRQMGTLPREGTKKAHDPLPEGKAPEGKRAVDAEFHLLRKQDGISPIGGRRRGIRAAAVGKKHLPPGKGPL